MEYIELLKANKKYYKYKFISLLIDKCLLTKFELSEIYEKLLNSESVKINLIPMNKSYLNDFIIDLMEIEINLGDSSFHEEN